MIPMISSYPRAAISSQAMKIICHGNSLTFGAGTSGTAARWPDRMKARAPLLDTGVEVVNSGVSGQRIASPGMRATGPTAVDALLDVSKQNVLFAWEFTNELSNNSFFAVSAHNQFVAYCNERRAAATAMGARLYIIVATVLPFRGSTWSDAEANTRMAAVASVNALIRANYRTYADQLYDVAALEPFQTMFTNNVWSASVFNAVPLWNQSNGQGRDNIHYGDSGYDLIGSGAAQAMRRVRRV